VKLEKLYGMRSMAEGLHPLIKNLWNIMRFSKGVWPSIKDETTEMEWIPQASVKSLDGKLLNSWPVFHK
jgi:hypothetical protein